MRRDLISWLIKSHWIFLVLLMAILGLIHSRMVNRKNVHVYEVETLPSNFEGEIDYFDPLAGNSHARLIHGDTPSDGGRAAFLGPRLDLAAGNYQAFFAVRALQLWPGIQPLRVEAGYSTGAELLASQAIEVQQLNQRAYDEIKVSFQLDSYTRDIEFRAFYPGQGAFWFDYLKVVKQTDAPWNMTYIYWPLLVGLLGVVLFINRRTDVNRISLNIALRNPAIEGRLAVIGYLTLLGIGLYSDFGKYVFDIERIVNAYIIDDAFYYFNTAANLARTGKMSFDGITFSNGFHPLWVFMLVPIYWLGLTKETSFLVGIILSDGISLAALLLLFRVLKRHFNVFLAFGLALLFFANTIYLIQYGLETPVLIGSFVALLAFYDSRFQRRLSEISFRDCCLLGFLLGVVFLARVDHGIFVATFLALFVIANRSSLSAVSERKKLILVLVTVVVLTMPFLLFNYLSTGHFVPVSGVIKSIWSDKMLLEVMQHSSYIQVKADSSLMVLAELESSFWLLTGSALILWVWLVRRQVGPTKTLLPFIFGPLLIFGYYLIFFQYPFNSSVWYYPTIWLAGIFTIGLVIDILLDQLLITNDSFAHGILIGGLTVLLAFQAISQINSQRGFHLWARTQTFEDSYKYLSWRAAEYIQEHNWSSGTDDKVVFAAADSGVLGFALDEPVVNLDGLINNEILPYELQDKHWYEYALARSEIDYVVNVFREDWSPPPLFAKHFQLCYFSQEFSRDNLGFRIYGRETAQQDAGRDRFTEGCVEGRVLSWWAGEMTGENDAPFQDNGTGNTRTVRCATPIESDGNSALVHGPRLSLPAGTYEVDYFLSVNDNTDASEAARLEITGSEDQPIAELHVSTIDIIRTGEFQRFTVPFRLNQYLDKLEFRIIPSGGQALCVQGISLLDCNHGCNP